MASTSQIMLFLALLLLLFYINIPPDNLSAFLSPQKTNTTVLAPYNITVNQTTIFKTPEGVELGSVTKQEIKTITPEQPQASFTSSITNLGAQVWPSQPTGGWVIIIIVAYFLLWPLLKFIKELIGL